MSMRDIFMAMALMGMNGSGVSDSQIAAAVSAYLDAHPVSAGIPIPETAGLGQTIVVKTVDAAGKPTAWETVDLPGASEVPDALPNPHTLTFTGAVSATYDGSEAVSVEIPSGGGGSAECDELLLGFTSTEEVTEIKLPLTGLASKINNAAQLKLYVHITLPSADEGTEFGKLTASIFRTWNIYIFFKELSKSPSNAYSWMSHSDIFSTITKSKDYGYHCSSGGVVKNNGDWAGDFYAGEGVTINDTDMLMLTSTLPMGVGTIVKLYARGTL